MAAIFLVASLLSLAIYNPLLGAFVTLFGASISAIFLLFWRAPHALVILTAGAGILLVDSAQRSYFIAQQAAFEPRETCYALMLIRGRIFAFRYEKWLPPVQSNISAYETGWAEFPNWPGYLTPQRRHKVLGFEHARGGFVPPLDMRTMRHRQFEYTMLAFPLWAIAVVIVAAALARWLFLHRRKNRSSTQTTHHQAASAAAPMTDGANRLFRLDGAATRFALLGIGLSLAYFLVAQGNAIDLWLDDSPKTIPIHLSTLVYLLLLIQTIAAFCIDLKLPEKFDSAALIVRRMLIGISALYAGIDALLSTGLVITPVTEEFFEALTIVRLIVSVLMCVGAIGFSVPWRAMTYKTPKNIGLITLICSAALCSLTWIIDIGSLPVPQRDGVRMLIISLMGLCALAQCACVIAIAVKEPEKGKTPLELILAAIAMLGFIVGLVSLDTDFGKLTTAQIARSILQLRISGVLIISGAGIYLLAARRSSASINSK